MLLTIAIPTYNRDRSLRATLLDVAAQIDRQTPDEVELVISDNCSTDQTSQVCAEVAATHPAVRIRYFKNEANVGFDRNVDGLFRHAEGHYVWTFSDDDRMRPDAIAKVVTLLREQEVCFAFANYEISIEGQTMTSRFGRGQDRWLHAPDLLKVIRFSNSLISSCIFNRKAWIEANASRHVGTLWIHFFAARDILRAGTGLIVGDPIFTMVQSGLEKSRAEKRKEDSDQVEYYMQAHLKFAQFASEMSAAGYDVESCKLARSISRREDVYQVINYKLTASSYVPKQILNTWIALAELRRSSAQFWLVTTPLLLAPGAAIRLLRALYRTVRAWR